MVVRLKTVRVVLLNIESSIKFLQLQATDKKQVGRRGWEMKSKWVDLSDSRLSLWFLSLHHIGVKPVLPEHSGQQTVGVTQRGHDQLSSEKQPLFPKRESWIVTFKM